MGGGGKRVGGVLMSRCSPAILLHMKTIHINNLYKPYAVGGAERVVESLAREGDCVISWRPWVGWGSWRPERTVEDGVVVYRYWVPNVFSYKNLGQHSFVARLLWHKIDLLNWWSGNIVKRILKEEKPDVVVTHNLMGIGYSVPRIIQRLKIKHVHYLHDVQLVEPSGVLPWDHTNDSWAQRMYQAVLKWRMGKPDEVVAPSVFLKEFYKERGFFKNAEWKLLRNERDPSTSRSLSAHEVARDDMSSYLYVGSLADHKGIRVLMQAWDRLSDSFTGTLHIVGDGELRDEVEQWAEKDHRIIVHGRLSRDGVEKMYEQCDSLLFTSTCIENRPNVIVEALEHDLHIIAAATGGVSELLVQTKNQLVEPGSVEELVRSILELSR